MAKEREEDELDRDSSSGEGGTRSVVTFLFWNGEDGAQWRRRWFISPVSASISESGGIDLHASLPLPIHEKC